jgi:hypothetical protein
MASDWSLTASVLEGAFSCKWSLYIVFICGPIKLGILCFVFFLVAKGKANILINI